ncbi:hypothetical protein K435DRAFT_854859 [Dendrothele bispora CBS 962.96]|uniref:Uncharacterized protein n=1 Tax=Dendrothele bispora (strain CBS 962.96) TaxID=1314807 RepID=A0A4S8MDH2_DENBC|nr:hypothetical protein K435DRAFT_854859 [Dendrothele bispora CBS 962.96]
MKRPGIEDSMEKSYSAAPATAGQRMSSIWQSPEWHRVQNMFPNHTRNLTFSFFIDWFNPFQNKIREQRFLPQNTFILAIIPGPHEPDPVTIVHILEPIVETLCALWAGKVFFTHRYPGGIEHQVASRAIFFCFWCKCTQNEKGRLDYEAWDMRHSASTGTGVCWSPLHDLPYYDPVHHLILGFMHNTLEGILQYHLQDLWHLGSREDGKEQSDFSDSEGSSGDELDDWDQEVEELSQEAQEFEASPEYALLTREPSSSQSSTTLSDSPHQPLLDADQYRSSSQLTESSSNNSQDDHEKDDTPVPSTHASVPPDSNSSGGSTFIYVDPNAPRHDFFFSTTELQAIRSCIQNISLPTYVGRPPGNLGEAKHGSLKAYDYFVLFLVIFPLILPEFWWFPDSTDYHKLLLNNFGHLVASTNIISAYSTSTNDADDYMHHYVQYRDSLTDLYSVTWNPNHHYAMHNGDLLRRWGPLAEVSEFFGERANHWGQTVKTNVM